MNPGSFSLSGNLNPTVAANGGTAAFAVQSRPALAAGYHSALITVTYNNGLTATAFVDITVN
jgi:hypothetical protein